MVPVLKMMMGFEEDGGGDFCSRCIGAAEGLLDWLCPLVAIGRLGVAFGVLMMCVGVCHPFIQVVGVASCR